jgi:hypothetical protein
MVLFFRIGVYVNFGLDLIELSRNPADISRGDDDAERIRDGSKRFARAMREEVPFCAGEKPICEAAI